MPGYPTDRVLVYNRDATFAFELTPDEQRSRLRVEQINDEHSLTIKTTRKLSEGMRLITQDDTGKIREHVVYKPDEGHHEGKYAIGTYLCMWSLQYDLMGSYASNHAEPGMGSSCTSRNAVVAALDGQSLWTVGTCDVPAVAAGKGCVMIGVSDWERLSLVVEHWHGEVDAEIVMDDTRVVARRVNFLAHVGSSTVTRRFDWAEDLTSIERHEDPGPYYCRVVPLGRGQREYAEDDETEFDWPLDISEETPDGRVYIEDGESALVFRTKLPDGTWHYPTKVVHYDEDDPELLLNAANADLHNHTRPGCSYEANVLQFARAGMDAKGVQLGDNTQCVDFGFNPDAGLTVEGRVTRLEVEELAPKTKTNLTIGDLAPTFAQTMQELVSRQTASISDGIKRVEGGGTIAYVENLLDAINAQIAADGGYTYLVGGQGNITYDRAVADPTIGAEATKVTQIKGGGIRIADEKKPSFSGINDWVWKSLIVAGHIAAELVTAAHITAGYIGSSGDTYIDLDNHTVQLGQTSGPHVVVDSSGMNIYDGSTSVGFFGVEQTTSIVRIGQASQGNVVMSSDGYVDIRNASTVMAHFGYASGKNISGGTSIAPYYSIGIRKASGTIGNYSVAEGYNTIAAGFASHAEGGEDTTTITGTIASGKFSHAEGAGTSASADCSHSEGYKTTASGYGSHAEGRSSYAEGIASHAEGDGSTHARGLASHAEGYGTTAYGSHSHAEGEGTYASGNNQHVCGTYNVTSSSHRLIVGNGTSNGTRSNAFYVSSTGNLWCAGTLTQGSDRRLKEHHAYLGEEASDFIRALRPALYTKDGTRHVGFYAQDVQDAEPEEWDTVTVTAQHTDESLDFDPLTLDYTAIIAPLVAYTQQLERHIESQQQQIDQQQEMIEALTKRLDNLESEQSR